MEKSLQSEDVHPSHKKKLSLQERWKVFLVGTPLNVLLWATTLIYGGYLSIFSDELKSITIEWAPEKPLSSHAIVALLGIIFLAIAFSWRSRAIEEKDQDRLTSIISSPPSDFLSYFAEHYDKAHAMATRNQMQFYHAKREFQSILWQLEQYGIDQDGSELPKPKPVDPQKLTLEAVPELPPIDDSLGDEEKQQNFERVKSLLLQAYSDRIELYEFTKTESEKHIRRMLLSMIELVKKWDARTTMGRNVIYRANVMRVEYFDTIHKRGELEAIHDACKRNQINPDDDEEKSQYRDILATAGKQGGESAVEEAFSKAKRFAVSPAENYTGVVELRDERFSVRSPGDGPYPDNRKPIAFPFTLPEPGNIPEHQNLLGAPAAIAGRRFEYVGDTRKIYTNYQGRHQTISWSAAVEEELRQYYMTENIDVAQSLLSIPLMSNYLSGLDGTLRVNWVVNVYRNQEGLLFDGERVSDFLDIIEPYLILLRTSLDDLRNES